MHACMQVEQVEAIAEAVPPHFKLDLDANATWQNAANAVPIMSKLKESKGWCDINVAEGLMRTASLPSTVLDLKLSCHVCQCQSGQSGQAVSLINRML
jgi:hypothetical protein